MKPNELHQLWQDALDELPHPPASDAHLERGLCALRARRRRTWTVQTLALTAAVLAIAASYFVVSQSPDEIAAKPQPIPQQPPEPIAPKGPESTMATIESVSLKDFLAQLPHHGYMTIENKRGRFLVTVDHETGETTTTRLSKDDQL